MNKPENCTICLELLNEDIPLDCGHWIHISCIQKQFKAECPLCRFPLKIEVYGKMDYAIDITDNNETIVENELNNDVLDLTSIIEIGYELEDNQSVDSIYSDEEIKNLHGDDWYYEYV